MTSIILRSKRSQVRILPGVLTENHTVSKVVLRVSIRPFILPCLGLFEDASVYRPV